MSRSSEEFSAEERAVFEAFVAKHLPRTTPLNGHPKLLIVNQSDLPLPNVMQWIHEHAPAIVSISTVEMMFNKMEGRSQRIGNGKILRIALEVVERLFAMRDKHTFKVGYNIVLILRGEYMNISGEVIRLATSLGAECKVYEHDELV